MGQSVKCLPYKYFEDLSPTPSTNIKMPNMVAQTYSLCTGEVETGEFLGLADIQPT